jgi:hypothetical protein
LHHYLRTELDQLKIERKTTPKHVEMKDLPEPERFQRLLPESKHFVDTIKLIAYRAETSMVSVIREKLARSDDARALLPPDLSHRGRPGAGSSCQDSHRPAASSGAECARRCGELPVRFISTLPKPSFRASACASCTNLARTNFLGDQDV